jgi:hypothetical protein
MSMTHHSPGVAADKITVKRAVWLLTLLMLLVACGTDSTTSPAASNDTTRDAQTSLTVTTSSSTTTSIPTTAVTTTERPTGRRVPDAPRPDGPCDGLGIRPNVFVLVDGAAPWLGCTQVAPSQRVLVANNGDQAIELSWGAHRIEVPPFRRDYTDAGRAGDLLAPGVHLLAGHQYWLVDEPPMRFASTSVEMSRLGPIALGMTVRDVEKSTGATLIVNPRFDGFDGRPAPSALRPMTPNGHAYFTPYDGSAPILTLRANGGDPLDATVVWISPAKGTVPSAVRVGWTEAQVRDVYGANLVDAQGLTCVLPNQKVLMVYDGPPSTGAHRLWFHFEDGRLATVSTSSVTLGETGVMDC